jgi:hypothetical protein
MYSFEFTYNGVQYTYINDARSFTAAKRYCESAVPGGRLAYGTALMTDTGGLSFPDWPEYWVSSRFPIL